MVIPHNHTNGISRAMRNMYTCAVSVYNKIKSFFSCWICGANADSVAPFRKSDQKSAGIFPEENRRLPEYTKSEMGYLNNSSHQKTFTETPRMRKNGSEKSIEQPYCSTDEANVYETNFQNPDDFRDSSHRREASGENEIEPIAVGTIPGPIEGGGDTNQTSLHIGRLRGASTESRQVPSMIVSGDATPTHPLSESESRHHSLNNICKTMCVAPPKSNGKDLWKRLSRDLRRGSNSNATHSGTVEISETGDITESCHDAEPIVIRRTSNSHKLLVFEALNAYDNDHQSLDNNLYPKSDTQEILREGNAFDDIIGKITNVDTLSIMDFADIANMTDGEMVTIVDTYCRTCEKCSKHLNQLCNGVISHEDIIQNILGDDTLYELIKIYSMVLEKCVKCISILAFSFCEDADQSAENAQRIANNNTSNEQLMKTVQIYSDFLDSALCIIDNLCNDNHILERTHVGLGCVKKDVLIQFIRVYDVHMGRYKFAFKELDPDSDHNYDNSRSPNETTRDYPLTREIIPSPARFSH